LVIAMSKEKVNATRSWEEIAALIPKQVRSSPLTVGRFYDLLAPIVKSHKELQQRVKQLEQQAGGNGGGHG
jgi:hypothetical protein